MKIKRETKIRLFMIKNNKFEVRNMDDNILFDCNSDYFIYMKNVNFRNGNIIEGRYLGELDEDYLEINDNNTVYSDGNNFYVNNKRIMKARMVAISNKRNAIIVIN